MMERDARDQGVKNEETRNAVRHRHPDSRHSQRYTAPSLWAHGQANVYSRPGVVETAGASRACGRPGCFYRVPGGGEGGLGTGR